jgi:hypothetical protein
VTQLWPLGWEHINLTGDYLWRRAVQAVATAATGLACFIFRFLRRPQLTITKIFTPVSH